MRQRVLLVAGVCVVALAMFGVGTSSADTVAVTGGAAQLTSTTARLNGHADPSGSDSAWFFQYSSPGHFPRRE